MAPLLIIFLLHVSHITIKFNGMMSDNNNINDGKNDSKVSWLILSKNAEKNVNRASSYRLAYRYVASSANNNDNVDVNNDNDKPVVLFCNGFRSASNSVSGGTKVNAVEEYCKIKSTTSTSVASIIVDMVYRQEILMI